MKGLTHWEEKVKLGFESSGMNDGQRKYLTRLGGGKGMTPEPASIFSHLPCAKLSPIFLPFDDIQKRKSLEGS